MAEFLVAKNPDASSSLRYLVFLPIEGGLWLKARETWPRGARVYCHHATVPDDAKLDIVERVPLVHCERRGPAIDVVLDRPANKRAQFVFTSVRGRAAIFWQTARAATAARPGVRIPFRPAKDVSFLLVDSRERYPYRFDARGITTQRYALPVGDYAVRRGDIIVAAVERKALDDFCGSLTDGSLGYAMAELATLRAAAVVVEGSYAQILRNPHVAAGFLADLIARVQVRYPMVPIVFAESRKLAEEWTYRFLRAASAHETDEQLAMPLASPQPKPIRLKEKAQPAPARVALAHIVATVGAANAAVLFGFEETQLAAFLPRAGRISAAKAEQVARVRDFVDRVAASIGAERVGAWLHRAHPRLTGETPLAEIARVGLEAVVLHLQDGRKSGVVRTELTVG